MTTLDVDTVLKAWFDQEINRAHALFVGEDFAAGIRPEGLDRPDARAFDRATTLEDAEGKLHRLQTEYNSGVYDAGKPVATIIARRLSPQIAEATPEFSALCKRVAELHGLVQEARIRWSSGDEGYRPTVGDTAPSDSASAEPDANHAPTEEVRTLREAVHRRLVTYQRGRHVKPRNLRQTTTELEVLLAACGEHTRVDKVTPLQMRRLVEALQDLPPRWRKMRELGAGTIFDRAKKARELRLEPLDEKTVGGHLSTWGQLFRDEGVRPNPTDDIQVKGGREYGPKREKGFVDSEIRTIFGHSLFQGAESASRPYSYGTYLANGWRFWAPLIGFFSGARVGEIAQLRPGDVLEVDEGGVKTWVLRITEESDGSRTLKNQASNRDVPVHEELVRIGLLELADFQRASGAKSLLPDCPTPVGGDPGKQISKWMSEKFLKRLGIKRKGLGMHGFRHRLTTLLRDAGVPQDAREALAGRVGTGSDANYGGWSMARLRNELHKIKVPADIRAIPLRRTAAKEAAATQQG
jgi:integrase